MSFQIHKTFVHLRTTIEENCLINKEINEIVKVIYYEYVSGLIQVF